MLMNVLKGICLIQDIIAAAIKIDSF
jgi:hypothetical protein